jgi:hypothetical protein
LWRIVTGEETWIYHFELQIKKVKWHRQISRKNFKTTPLAGKVVAIAFWDAEGVVVVNITLVQTISSDMHVQTLKTFQKRFRRVAEIPSQHDNPRTHTRYKTQ